MTQFISQPQLPPFINFQVVDFKVVDPAASDPNAPVFTLSTGQAFTFVVKVKGSGSIWTGSHLDTQPTWQTRFFANALGIDVAGERNIGPVTGALTLETPPDVYKIQLSVPGGLTTEGVYELGATIRLPANGIHGSASEYQLDVAVP